MEDPAPTTGNVTPPSHGEPITCNDTTSEGCEDGYSSISIGIVSEIWGAEKASEIKETSAPRIPKVPSNLEFNYSLNKALLRWTKPSVISIGPYYYGCKEFQRVQNLKARYAARFISESKQDKDVLFKRIREKTPALRKWYSNYEIKKFDDDQLATIFLLDGCFLLYFINNSCKEDGFTNLNLTIGDMANIKQDLFLLENQLPYPVLELLFKKASFTTWMELNIENFVAFHAGPISPGIWSEEVVTAVSDCDHLLHYLCAVLPEKPAERDSPNRRRGRRRARNRIRGLCRTVKLLMEVGVYFEPSDTSSLADISFKPDDFSTGGCLRLPTLSMSNSIMKTFLNLIAFEYSITTENNLSVISYLCFMDSLIDSWENVRELQAAGILRNYVGGPKEVAQFFNTVCSNLVPNPFAYRDVILEIESHLERHYNSRMRKWCIQCKEKYFSSPWSCIALIAAIIGLSLTAIQAFTSVFPR